MSLLVDWEQLKDLRCILFGMVFEARKSFVVPCFLFWEWMYVSEEDSGGQKNWDWERKEWGGGIRGEEDYSTENYQPPPPPIASEYQLKTK